MRSKPFVAETHLNMTGLDKYVGYRFTVASIFDDATDGFAESSQSEPLFVSDSKFAVSTC